MPTPNDWVTLYEAFLQSGGTFPFTVEWNGHLRHMTEETPYLITFVSGRGTDRNQFGGFASWQPSQDAFDDFPQDMEVHDGEGGWASERRYRVLVAASEAVRGVDMSTRKSRFKLDVQEITTKYSTKEYKEDEEYRKVIGLVKRLEKKVPSSTGRYLKQAGDNLRQARAVVSPRGMQNPSRKFTLSWKDPRFPKTLTTPIKASYNLAWLSNAMDKASVTVYQEQRKSAYKNAYTHLRQQISLLRANARQVAEQRKVFTSRANGARISYATTGSLRVVRARDFKFSKPEYEVSNPSIAGGIHSTEGSIEWLYYRKTGGIKLNEPKTPRTDDKHVGIELEFISKADADKLGLMLFKAGLVNYVQLKADGSIRTENNYPHPHEICVLAKETEYEGIIEKLAKVLEAAGSKVNKSCGMHVHVDMRTRNREVAFANLVSSQNILYAMNPPSRLEPSDNGTVYSAYTRSRKMDSQSGRYYGINGTAYQRHRTIEIRIHSGTFQARKIINWVKILLHVCNRTTAVARSSSKLRGFVKQFDIPIELAEYIVERVKKFQDKTAPLIEEAA